MCGLSQVELRTKLWLSGDKTVVQTFKSKHAHLLFSGYCYLSGLLLRFLLDKFYLYEIANA